MLIEDIVKASDISEETGAEMIIISPETTLLDITRVLSRNHVGLALVLDETEKLVGVVSERDIIIAIAKNGTQSLLTPAGEVMTRDVKTCSPRDNPKNVINTMSEGRFRHLPVLDEGRLAGLVSSSDILKYLSDKMTPEEQFQIWAKSFWV